MPADYTIVQGDSEPIFTNTLEYANGEKANLTGCTCQLIVRALTAERPLTLAGATSITAPTTGGVAYSPSEADPWTPGNYMANWLVTGGAIGRMTFPTVGYEWITVQENLSTPGGAQIVGLPEVKDHMKMDSGDHGHDELLIRYIAAVAPLIENLTGPILPQVYDEWYEGGHSTISLRHKPSFGFGTKPFLQLMAVSEYRGPIEYNLSIVGTPTQGSVYSTMANNELGTIVRRTSGGGTTPFWSDPSHPSQSIHVVYAAGQETVPANVTMAACETIRWWFETTENVGKGSLTQADAEVIRPMVALPYHAEAMLGPTRRHPAFA